MADYADLVLGVGCDRHKAGVTGHFVNRFGLMIVDKAGHVSLYEVFRLASEGYADLFRGVTSAHDLSAGTVTDTDPFRPINILIDEVLREHLRFRR